MRWMTLALLALASAACNQILGLRATRQVDAAPAMPDAPPDAMWPMLTIARPVLASVTPETIASGWSSTGADPPPMVLVGPIGGPLQLVPIDDQGQFRVPIELVGGPYRIVYALPGDAPTEIQWSGSAGTFAVPLFGRADRGTPPAGAELEFKPSGAPASIANARVLTTGLWTRAPGLGTVGPTYDFPYPSLSQSPSGPPGSLDGTRGDVEVLASCGDATNPGRVTAFAAMKVDHLIQMTRVSAASTWTAPALTTLMATFSENQVRLIDALGVSSGTFLGAHAAGVVPSLALAPFTRPVPGGLDDGMFDELYSGSTLPLKFANPFDGNNPPAPQLPLVVYGSYTETRVTTAPSGIALTSGFEELAPASTSGTTAIGYEVGIARQVSLGGTALTASNLADGQVVDSAGQPMLDLSFDVDQPVSDCLVTVYKIAGGQLAAVRRYLVAQPTPLAPTKLDTSVFAPMTDHVLAITCRLGSRKMTDFTQVSFPYEESTLYTTVFRVQ